MHESFDFSPTYGSYTLTIELVLPIDFIVVKVTYIFFYFVISIIEYAPGKIGGSGKELFRCL